MDDVLDEYFKNRTDILEDSRDEGGFIEQSQILEQFLPHMFDNKLIDSEDTQDSYLKDDSSGFKLNSFAVNESGERLQLFIISEGTVDESVSEKDLLVSEKSIYEKQFQRVSKFVKQSLKGQLKDLFQGADPVMALITQLGSDEKIEEFDVIEIFLISLTATVLKKSSDPEPRSIRFDDEEISVNYMINSEKKKKEVLLLRQVIDLNFITNSIASRGNSQELVVNFKKSFGYGIEVVEAANESHFQSYLCVLEADVLFDLYKRYSTRLLEKNVRSFLQFNRGGVNQGLKKTIREEPEKFIAYNNGLTITASDVNFSNYKKKKRIESLTDFQIVNGGQTTAAIYFSKKEGLDVSKVKVMAKINVINEDNSNALDELVSSISKFSNSQSKVSNVDLNARNPQLVEIKRLSNSVLTPKGDKWFFERLRGEFNTHVKMKGTSSRLKKEYPRDKRFDKGQLGKYYCAWGAVPYLVKLGGDKIFGHFIRELSPEDTSLAIEINREFYEELIAKIIFFRRLEKVHGAAKNAIGQLRAAVIPYSLSILYIITDGSNQNIRFDLARIWKDQDIEKDLAEYFYELMVLMNKLIKMYSVSDDFGEATKKIELWNSIKGCNEIETFLSSENSKKIVDKYTYSVSQT
tara:strand:+ start:1908 stop:3809 length:1902 start_codon:yes stop_codon:yes gene_type:complete